MRAPLLQVNDDDEVEIIVPDPLVPDKVSRNIPIQTKVPEHQKILTKVLEHQRQRAAQRPNVSKVIRTKVVPESPNAAKSTPSEKQSEEDRPEEKRRSRRIRQKVGNRRISNHDS